MALLPAVRNAKRLIMLRVEGAHLNFGGVRALSGVSIEIQQGLTTGLIGPNGSGKSTLFNVITGLYRPSRGTITFQGKSLLGLKPSEVTRTGVARTFQNKRLFGSLSIFENVLVAALKGQPGSAVGDVLGSRIARQGLASARQLASECLELVGLSDHSEQEARSLAYGRQNRLELARALASQPELLLLDEPAAGLNPRERAELAELVGRIRERGVTIAMVEHDMRLVMGLCSHIFVLDQGRVIASGSPAIVANDPAVIAAYFGQVTVQGGGDVR